MVTEIFLNAVFLLIAGVVALFPALPNVDTSSLDGFFQALSLVDTFVSLKVVAGCFVTIFLFMNLEAVWSIVMWVVRKIPGIE